MYRYMHEYMCTHKSNVVVLMVLGIYETKIHLVKKFA